jgi:23S rRNA pseudouridine2605 synthase
MPKNHFEKFVKTKSNAAKKEDFRKAKREIKKEIHEGMARTKARKAEEANAKAVVKATKMPKGGYPGAPGKRTDARTDARPGGGAHPAPAKGPRPSDDARKDRSKAEGRPVRLAVKGNPERPLTPAKNKDGSVRLEPNKHPTGAKRRTGNEPPARKTATAKPAASKRPSETLPPKTSVGAKSHAKPEDQMPLNKYIAHGGLCSRREAADWIKEGQVKVNGTLVTEPGFKVGEGDDVKVNGKKIVPSKNLVYILLNKPKDYITTSSDPEGRKTVLDLVRHATDERIFPIGRLDRNTTGVLLLTNDGELTQKLSHPAFQVKKIYEVRLDRELIKKDFESIMNGINLEDGVIIPDSLAYADSKDRSIIGIEIHSGKNRIVRRIFEHLGYEVKNLDRVMYAGLTKKNVDRGRWRYLSDKEVRILKFLNASYAAKNQPINESKVQK